MLRKKSTLIITIIIFLIVAGCALKLVLDKGYVNGESLVPYEIIPEFSSSCDKEYLSITDDEQATISILQDGEEMTEGYKISVSDEDIVSLKDKTVTAKKIGNATIKVEVPEYDYITTYEVSVYRPIKDMKLTSVSTVLKKGNDRQLNLTTNPPQATRTYVTYESSNPDIATVNNNGIITGVSKGTVTITATDKLTGKTASIKQTVQ